MLISIVGKSGSGKSYIAELLTNYIANSLYIDIDDISHKVLEKTSVKQRLIDTFGKSIIVVNEIDRKDCF